MVAKKSGGFAAVILAAGRGTRMKSDLPKALHEICGKPMLGHLLETVKTLGPKRIVVVGGWRIELVRRYVRNTAQVIRQKKLLGSGHAVSQAEPTLKGFSGPVMVLYCDTPFLSAATLRRLLQTHRDAQADGVLLAVTAGDPAGYGRVRRDASGAVQKIIEENDASADEKAIREVNVGCYVFQASKLFGALGRIRKNPKKKEYYLTDAVEILAREGKMESVVTEDLQEALGVNTGRDLAAFEEKTQRRILESWMDKGVRIRDPKTTTVDADVKIGAGTKILPHTVIEDGSVIGKACVIGPFARIRGGSRIGDGAVIGNFVEVVRSTVGKDSQIKHLSYIGDATVGASVNIGAGTITANFDGRVKRKTVIKDGARIGSGTILIAPVTVGRKAVTGAGAVVTKGKNVPDRGVVAGVPARPIGRHAR